MTTIFKYFHYFQNPLSAKSNFNFRSSSTFSELNSKAELLPNDLEERIEYLFCNFVIFKKKYIPELKLWINCPNRSTLLFFGLLFKLSHSNICLRYLTIFSEAIRLEVERSISDVSSNNKPFLNLCLK
ncbi:hypothetical protein BLOT_011435 [Blomia tropicalis]|nr:hypothetical protein BLOT_011435 [Blomia tropicalis]